MRPYDTTPQLSPQPSLVECAYCHQQVRPTTITRQTAKRGRYLCRTCDRAITTMITKRRAGGNRRPSIFRHDWEVAV